MRAISPEQNATELAAKRYAMGHIMPSNTVTTSPNGGLRVLSTNEPVTKSARFNSQLKKEITNESESRIEQQTIRRRIQELESRKQSLLLTNGADAPAVETLPMNGSADSKESLPMMMPMNTSPPKPSSIMLPIVVSDPQAVQASNIAVQQQQILEETLLSLKDAVNSPHAPATEASLLERINDLESRQLELKGMVTNWAVRPHNAQAATMAPTPAGQFIPASPPSAFVLPKTEPALAGDAERTNMLSMLALCC
jgi:hypothetical protein